MFGTVMVPLLRTRFGTRLFGRGLTRLSYLGRRSGKTVELVVAYRRQGEHYIVGVMAPEQKSWWRNFTGDGAPLTLQLGATTISGHGVAVRDGETSIVITPDTLTGSG